MKRCPKCGLKHEDSVESCDCGYYFTPGGNKIGGDREEYDYKGVIIFMLIGLAIVVIIAAGFFRIYYGGGIRVRVVAKHSFSFKDTVVNLDDIFGMPRIAVATKHPAVKKQLEEMGITETDEQVQERIRREIEEESKRMMRDIEEETKRLQRETGF